MGASHHDLTSIIRSESPLSSSKHDRVSKEIRSFERGNCRRVEHRRFPEGSGRWQGKDYAKIPGEELRTLGEGIRGAVGDIPGSALDLPEMGRTMAWVDRQRTVPMARLQGERVRKRNPTRVNSEREESEN